MRTMRITAFGGPEVFEAAEAPRPEAGPGQVLVRLLATSVNPVDYKIRKSGAWAGVKPPFVIGYDGAGVVEAVGPGVTSLAPGTKVFYTPQIFGRPGTYAEYQAVEAEIVVEKPANLTFLEATVLVHAGAGGVGSRAVQLARLSGARVIATASAANAELVRSLGAEVVIDYRAEPVAPAVLRATGGRGVEVAIDTVGGDTLAKTIPAMRPYGRLVTCVSSTADLSAALGKNLTFHFEFLERARFKMEALQTLAARGALRPVIDSVRPLAEVAEAHRRVEAGGMRGKVVLRIADGADER